MRKEKIKTSMGFQLSIIPWILMYPLIGQLICWRIEEIFQFLLDERAVAASIDRYMDSVNTMLVIAIVLSVIWWVLACNTTKLRRIFEENTIIFGAVFALCLLIAVAIGPADMVIRDDLDNEYKLMMEWCVFGGFAFNMFLFSPQNVRRVVFIKGNLGRVLMAVLVLVISAFCMWKGVW